MSKNHPIYNIREGMKYVISHSNIKILMITLTVTSFFGISFAQLLSIYVHDHETLNLDPHFFFSTFSAFGFGRLIGTVLGAKLVHSKSEFGYVCFYLILLYCTAIAFALYLDFFWGIIISILMIGLFGILIVNLISGMIQTECDESMRGRVSSIAQLTYGLQLFSAALAGFFIHLISDFTSSDSFAFILVQSSGVLFMAVFSFWMLPFFRKLNKQVF
jgi:MFS family permease